MRPRMPRLSAGSYPPGVAIRWTAAFLDYPAVSFDQGSAFWQAVTASVCPRKPGIRPSSQHCFQQMVMLSCVCSDCTMARQAATLTCTPTMCGRPHLRRSSSVPQSIGEPDGYVVLRSPGGLRFWSSAMTARGNGQSPRPWPGGHNSLVDQLSIDISPEYYGPRMRILVSADRLAADSRLAT